MVLDGGGVGGHRLDGGAGLALNLRGAVQTPLHLVRPTAHHGGDFAVCGIHGDQRRLHGRAVVSGIGEVRAVLKERVGAGLQGNVQRGVDVQPAGENLLRVRIQRIHGLLQHQIHVPAVGILLRLGHFQVQGLRLCLSARRLGDCPGFQHRVQYAVAPGEGVLRVQVGRVVRGGLDDPGQQRALCQREFPNVLAEVSPGGAADAVGAVSEVHRVQIGLQNLILRHHALQLARQIRLLHLPG